MKLAEMPAFFVLKFCGKAVLQDGENDSETEKIL